MLRHWEAMRGTLVRKEYLPHLTCVMLLYEIHGALLQFLAWGFGKCLQRICCPGKFLLFFFFLCVLQARKAPHKETPWVIRNKEYKLKIQLWVFWDEDEISNSFSKFALWKHRNHAVSYKLALEIKGLAQAPLQEFHYLLQHSCFTHIRGSHS